MSFTSFITHALGSGTGGDPGATAQLQQALLEQQNAQHQAAITQGQNEIDSAFSQFNPAYYDKYRQSYISNYQPQLDDQYKLSQDKLTSLLAGQGVLAGTPGANALEQLFKTYGTQSADIANQASDATNSLKSNVSNVESNLYNLNAAAANPYSIGTQAQAAAGSIVAPQSYPTLGNVFQDALSGFGTAGKTASQAYGIPTGQQGSTVAQGQGSVGWGQ